MNKIHLDKICRICGGIFHDIYKTIRDLEDHIFKYLPIKIQDNINGYPQTICADCASTISSWNEFYNRCKLTQKRFAEIFNKEKLVCDSQSEDDTVSLSQKITNSSNYLHQFIGRDLEQNKKRRKNVYNCNFCSACSDSQRLLSEHLREKHGDMVFCCDLCNTFKPRETLISHMTKHALDSIKPIDGVKKLKKSSKFHCPDCEKDFTGSCELNSHVNSCHSLNTQFPCVECEHIFPTKDSPLRRVRSSHSAEKLFKCNFCDKEFKTDATLIRHHQKHFKVTPYKCPDCGKEFRFKHNLRIHSKQHKPKEEKSEGEQINKLENLEKTQKPLDFTCFICDLKLLKKRCLREHMKKVHRTDLQYFGVR